VLEIAKQKIGNKRKEMNQKKKKMGSTYLAAAHLAEDQAGPTPSPAAHPTYRFSHLLPLVNKQLGGALRDLRSIADDSTRRMTTAALRRL
jgi:hypothetical protein